MLSQASIDEQGDECELMMYDGQVDSEENDLDGFIVRDNFVEYMDENDSFLDDDDEDTDSIPPLPPKRKRLIRAAPETDDEEPVEKKRHWRIVVSDDEDV